MSRPQPADRVCTNPISEETYVALFRKKPPEELSQYSSGNPAIMVLLEQDTYDFKRHLGGIPAYFRNKIRKAMREDAKIEETRINHDGREISAHVVDLPGP